MQYFSSFLSMLIAEGEIKPEALIYVVLLGFWLNEEKNMESQDCIIIIYPNL